MSEHPILFTGAMVRAILRGDKTQTRRVIKPQPRQVSDESPLIQTIGHKLIALQKQYCPYGVPGDLLWVREAFCYAMTTGYDAREDGGEYWYRATDKGQVDTEDGGWIPSIFMPKCACRLWLRVKSVRVQRVQDISEEGALAEGIECHCNTGQSEYDKCSLTPQEHFANLWDSINGKRGYGWEVNPWVWVIEFEQEKPK